MIRLDTIAPPHPAALPGLEPPPLLASAAPFEWAQADLHLLGLAFLALIGAAFFSTLRRAMALADLEHLLPNAGDDGEADHIRTLFGRFDTLSTSATILETGLQLAFVTVVLVFVANEGTPEWPDVLITLLACVPLIWFATDAVAKALALRSGDVLVMRVLPTFHVLQLPISVVPMVLEGIRRGVLRALGLNDRTDVTRQIVAGLREVIEDADVSDRHLDETEKELIGNVMEFRDVDVAAVMTPRTKVEAVEVEEGLQGAAVRVAETGHSRIPVYEDTLDQIVGTVSARDLVQVVAAERLGETSLSEIQHPAYFVPETKHISELLAELRRQKIKMAIVLDEYGGTAGIVTVGDILSEIVGDIPDEYDKDEPSPIRHMPGGAAEVEANLHVTEVNEALELDIPEESDYETLGGFVLAELGHFPVRGEAFTYDGAEYSVLEANDRRVLKVRVRRLESA